jgi:hypothetical protein
MNWYLYLSNVARMSAAKSGDYLVVSSRMSLRSRGLPLPPSAIKRSAQKDDPPVMRSERRIPGRSRNIRMPMAIFLSEALLRDGGKEMRDEPVFALEPGRDVVNGD